MIAIFIKLGDKNVDELPTTDLLREGFNEIKLLHAIAVQSLFPELNLSSSASNHRSITAQSLLQLELPQQNKSELNYRYEYS